MVIDEIAQIIRGIRQYDDFKGENILEKFCLVQFLIYPDTDIRCGMCKYSSPYRFYCNRPWICK